jgi:hypothetical protein
MEEIRWPQLGRNRWLLTRAGVSGRHIVGSERCHLCRERSASNQLRLHTLVAERVAHCRRRALTCEVERSSEKCWDRQRRCRCHVYRVRADATDRVSEATGCVTHNASEIACGVQHGSPDHVSDLIRVKTGVGSTPAPPGPTRQGSRGLAVHLRWAIRKGRTCAESRTVETLTSDEPIMTSMPAASCTITAERTTHEAGAVRRRARYPPQT